MNLDDLDAGRRVLSHLPPWRNPTVAKAWSAHEQAHGAPASIVGYTVPELTARLLTHDPHISFDVTEESVEQALEDLRAEGLARVDKTERWSQTKAGLDLLTDGNAAAHSQHVASVIAQEKQ